MGARALNVPGGRVAYLASAEEAGTDLASGTPGPARLTVVVRVGGADRPLVVTVQRIPAVAQDMPSLPPGSRQQVAVQNGVTQVPVPSLADGDAYLITAG